MSSNRFLGQRSRRGLFVILVTLAVVGVWTGSSEDGRVVRSAEFGSAWPLLAPEAHLRCEGGAALTAEVNGARYALNGHAIGMGYPRLDPVWRDSPDPNQPKVSISPLMEAARQLCE